MGICVEGRAMILRTRTEQQNCFGGIFGGYFLCRRRYSRVSIVIFSKGERTNLSQTERNELKQILGSLANVYKKGVKHNVQSRK